MYRAGNARLSIPTWTQFDIERREYVLFFLRLWLAAAHDRLHPGGLDSDGVDDLGIEAELLFDHQGPVAGTLFKFQARDVIELWQQQQPRRLPGLEVFDQLMVSTIVILGLQK